MVSLTLVVGCLVVFVVAAQAKPNAANAATLMSGSAVQNGPKPKPNGPAAGGNNPPKPVSTIALIGTQNGMPTGPVNAPQPVVGPKPAVMPVAPNLVSSGSFQPTHIVVGVQQPMPAGPGFSGGFSGVGGFGGDGEHQWPCHAPSNDSFFFKMLDDDTQAKISAAWAGYVDGDNCTTQQAATRDIIEDHFEAKIMDAAQNQSISEEATDLLKKAMDVYRSWEDASQAVKNEIMGVFKSVFNFGAMMSQGPHTMMSQGSPPVMAQGPSPNNPPGPPPGPSPNNPPGPPPGPSPNKPPGPPPGPPSNNPNNQGGAPMMSVGPMHQ